MISEFRRRRVLQIYPQIAGASPPTDIGPSRATPLRVGESPHCIANYFWSGHQRSHREREPSDLKSVFGPFVGCGSCLHPLRAAGEELWFDPTIAAQAGDVVLVQYEFPAQTERNELGLMAKLLVEFAGEYWLAFNTGMFPLADIRILGVEVSMTPSSWRCSAFSNRAV